MQQANSSGSVDTMQKAIDHLRKSGVKARSIGAELAFLPVDAGTVLRDAFADSEIKDALFVLERLRAIKRPEELAKLRIASERVIDSMLAVIASHGPGASKAELTEALRREETSRGLTFEYCLITAGTSLNRAPSDQKWGDGEILSLNSGGNYHGYIGDLCRMAIHGEPDAELEDMLAEIEDDPARRDEADQGGRDRQRNLCGGGAAGAQVQAPQPHAFPRPRHGTGQPRGAAPHRDRAGAVRRLRRQAAARDRHGGLGRDHAGASTSAASSSSRTPWSSRLRASISMAKAAAAGTAAAPPREHNPRYRGGAPVVPAGWPGTRRWRCPGEKSP